MLGEKDMEGQDRSWNFKEGYRSKLRNIEVHREKTWKLVEGHGNGGVKNGTSWKDMKVIRVKRKTNLTP
jgi:hypothetical protein